MTTLGPQKLTREVIRNECREALTTTADRSLAECFVGGSSVYIPELQIHGPLEIAMNECRLS